MSGSMSDSELGVLGELAELGEDGIGDTGCGDCSSTGEGDGKNDFGSNPEDGELTGLSEMGEDACESDTWGFSGDNGGNKNLGKKLDVGERAPSDFVRMGDT
jgi:hypothetical protein